MSESNKTGSNGFTDTHYGAREVILLVLNEKKVVVLTTTDKLSPINSLGRSKLEDQETAEFIAHLNNEINSHKGGYHLRAKGRSFNGHSCLEIHAIGVLVSISIMPVTEWWVT